MKKSPLVDYAGTFVEIRIGRIDVLGKREIKRQKKPYNSNKKDGRTQNLLAATLYRRHNSIESLIPLIQDPEHSTCYERGSFRCKIAGTKISWVLPLKPVASEAEWMLQMYRFFHTPNEWIVQYAEWTNCSNSRLLKEQMNEIFD